jgi:predicted DNA binding CopG/RHH family protein
MSTKKKKGLNIPKFKNEDEEREFWASIDLADYFEARDFRPVSFPNLKPSSRAISLRLPEAMLMRLKEQANELQVPYQALIKQYVAEGLSHAA